jgi:hypothetical protein
MMILCVPILTTATLTANGLNHYRTYLARDDAVLPKKELKPMVVIRHRTIRGPERQPLSFTPSWMFSSLVPRFHFDEQGVSH